MLAQIIQGLLAFDMLLVVLLVFRGHCLGRFTKPRSAKVTPKSVTQ